MYSKSELASYLDRREKSNRNFCVHMHNEPSSKIVIEEEFERAFHIHYIPSLKFASEEALAEVIHNCPYLLRYVLKESTKLGEKLRERIAAGFVADTSICWVSPLMGYGLFANQAIKKGGYIGEYTGVVRRVERIAPLINAYCFQYPTKLWSFKYFVIDASKEGNELRFVNHSDAPNLTPAWALDRGLLHMAFFASRDIKSGEELFFDYGEDYWQRREKL